jgi:hypothetical protein
MICAPLLDSMPFFQRQHGTADESPYFAITK